MNKYQKARNHLIKIIDIARAYKSEPLKTEEAIGIIQELVDKETPKKIIKLPYKDIYGNKIGDSKTQFFNGCPNCKDNVGIQAEYCRHCGQKLDWGEGKK